MKLYIVGIVASGKTTMARKLSERTGIPWYELDVIVHADEIPEKRRRRTPEEQVAEIERIDAQGAWIIEGTYRGSCHCLLDKADQVVFLNTPLPVRLMRIVRRYIRQRLGVEACHYHPGFAMLRNMFRWTWEFERRRSGFMDILRAYGGKVSVIRSPGEFTL